MFYDAHNHLQDAWLTPHRAQVLADLASLPLRRAVVNGTAETDWPDVAALARAHPFVLPSYGLHPWNLGNASPHWRDTLRRTLDADPRAAVGEIGLDRWIIDRAHPDDSRLAGLRRASLDEQREAFVWQLTLAAERNLPVTIHCIDAWGALLEVLRATPRPRRGFLLHAYASSTELARDFAALGAYFSFNGSFLASAQCHVIRDISLSLPSWSPKQSHVLRDITRGARPREVFRQLPLDRVLAETDAPAMPPPENARPYSLPGLADANPINHPANIGAVYAGLAALRGIPLGTLAAQLERNFSAFFGSDATLAPGDR